MKPILYIVIPCFNEQDVLPRTGPCFLKKLRSLIGKNSIDDKSRILFVDDGSSDDTWEIIQKMAEEDEHFIGVRLSRNRGHQNALLAGLMEAKELCDITISIDCDGQDDINAMDEMIACYENGFEVVYGVRSKRDKDSFFKRFTAHTFYKLLSVMGVEIVYDHADYRLVSNRVLREFADFHEVNLFLRGMIPLVGFPSAKVYYERQERIAGKSHYPIGKMFSFALDGITSLSIKPIRMITATGMMITVISIIGILWAIISYVAGETVSGWASVICIICFFGGAILFSLGVIGEYVGKTYIETKARPRFIISEKTYGVKENINCQH